VSEQGVQLRPPGLAGALPRASIPFFGSVSEYWHNCVSFSVPSAAESVDD